MGVNVHLHMLHTHALDTRVSSKLENVLELSQTFPPLQNFVSITDASRSWTPQSGSSRLLVPGIADCRESRVISGYWAIREIRACNAWSTYVPWRGLGSITRRSLSIWSTDRFSWSPAVVRQLEDNRIAFQQLHSLQVLASFSDLDFCLVFTC
jgi:hypothetical protein